MLENNRSIDIKVREETPLKRLLDFFVHTPIREAIFQSLFLLMGMLTIFWLPLSKGPVPTLVFFFILTWLLNWNQLEWKEVSLKTKNISFLLVIFYLWQVITLFWSTNIHKALFDLEVKLSILILPLIFISSSKIISRNKNLILKLFVFGNLIALFLCFLGALVNSVITNNGILEFQTSVYAGFSDQSIFYLIGHRLSYFSYAYFSKFHHPTYFAMFLNFGIIIAYYFYRIATKKSIKIVYLIILSIFSIGIYLLSTRSGLITLLFSLIILTIIEMRQNYNWILAKAIGLFLVFGLFKALSSSLLRTNLKELKVFVQNNSSAEPILDIKESDARLLIWNATLEQISKNFWFGVGNGDVKSTLISQYKKNDFKAGVSNKLNSHNQYLESQLAGGIFSFILLLLMLVGGLIKAIKKQNLILGFFIVLVAFNFLFESMLNTLAGVLFFAFFYSFLTNLEFPKLTKKQKEVTLH